MNSAPDSAQVADLETALFISALHTRFGADFRGYAPALMRDRLTAIVQERLAGSISRLQGEVLRDERLGLEVIAAMRGGFASPLGSADCLMALRCAAVSLLSSSPWPAIWLADCSDIDLMVLLAAWLVEDGLRPHVHLHVTSPSETFKDDMLTLTISTDRLQALEVRYRYSGGRNFLQGHFYQHGDGFVLGPAMRNRLTCHTHDLASDASFGEFQTIVCARSFEEYGPALRERALGVFAKSLCTFGILQVDVPKASRGAFTLHPFTPVLPAHGIYRRLPSDQ